MIEVSYLNSDPRDMRGALNTVVLPLNKVGERGLCPGSAALHKVNESLR